MKHRHNSNLIHQHAIALAGTISEFPFGPEVMVYKVLGKMFALISTEDTPRRLTLKCQPDEGVQLCDLYNSIKPGYHMNKKHWITVVLDDEVPKKKIIDLLENSYELVLKKIPKKERESLTGTSV